MNSDKPSVLIVDDTVENLQILTEVLKEDYSIKVAKDGEKALQLTDQKPRPDIILLDIMMPGMDGYEVCRRLKADPDTQSIPIIFVSALDNTLDEAKGLALGAIDYITKPISPAIVLARIKNHLELQQAHKSLQAQNQALVEAAKLREDVDNITRHDLKGALNIITNVPQLLKMDDNLTQEQHELLQHVEDAGYQMLDQINRSLDLYKMETGRYNYQPSTVNLIPILQRIQTENNQALTDHQLELTIQQEGSPLEAGDEFHIQGESLLCHTLFSNLIKNAVEAAPRETCITIDLNHDDSGAIISIHNMGTVPESIRDSFFKKYSTAEKSRGTGLGTYSAHLMAKTQNGNVRMETSDEHGTTLYITLIAA